MKNIKECLSPKQLEQIKENVRIFKNEKDALLNKLQQSLKEDIYRDNNSDKETRDNLIVLEYKKQVHEAFVKYCLCPKVYETNNKIVYACVTNIENANDVNYANFSVVTPSMAYIDNRYFVSGDKNDNEDNIWWKDYRPYYYEFSAILSDDQLNCFKSQIKNLKESSNNYNKGCFWFKAEIKNDSKPGQGEYFGILNFGGSQSFSEGIVFSSFGPIGNDLSESLKDTYHIKIKSNNNKCVKYLDKFFPKFTPFNVKVYNVGQANCIYIKDPKSSKRFFFDYGRPNDAYSNKRYPNPIKNPDVKPGTDVCNNLENIKLLPRDLIIVSHWHTDHFAAYKDLDDYGINNVWILPKIDIKYDIKSANRFLNYLVKNHAEVYYLNSIGKIYDHSEVQLFSSTHSWKSDPNTRCLILKIKDTVFSADCLYEFWPDDLKSNLNNVNRLIVPHHCSQRNKTKKGLTESHNIINGFGNTTGKKEAYISVGFNIFGHPNADHKSELSNAGFRIFETNCSTDGYEFIIS